MNLKTITRAFAAAAISLSLAACGINSVPTKEEAAKAEGADVESAYQRRADLIPNLVSTVRGAAASEGKILKDVMDARARASSIQIDAEDLNDPDTFEAFEEAQGELSSVLTRLMAVTENYPELRSQEAFLGLMDQLEGTENRIDNARTKYNEAVRDYNTTIRTFPDTIGANIIHGAEPMEGFKAKKGADEAPDVDLENIGDS